MADNSASDLSCRVITRKRHRLPYESDPPPKVKAKSTKTTVSVSSTQSTVTVSGSISDAVGGAIQFGSSGPDTCDLALCSTGTASSHDQDDVPDNPPSDDRPVVVPDW